MEQPPLPPPTQELIDQLADFCHGLRSLALFGSFLHGDADDTSDIDLLLEMEPASRPPK